MVILEIIKTLMYEFWYDYLQPKYEDNLKLCYMDTDSFISQVETKNSYADVSNDVEDRSDTSAYSNEINRPISIGKNKKVFEMMKDELCGKIMTEFVALRAKTYSYLDYDSKEEKKAKRTKKVCCKKKN